MSGLPTPIIDGGLPSPAAFDESPFLKRALELQVQGNEQDAYRVLVAACANEPNNPAAWYRLGVSLMNARKWGASAACFRRAEFLYPGDAGQMTNLGWTLHKAGQSDEAALWLRRAIAKAPELPLAYTNLAQVELTRGRVQQALESSTGAARLSADPIHGLSHAFALFADGQYGAGFAAYEARIPYRLKEYQTYPYPRWDGQHAMTLYVQAEQGLGDAIMGLRWLAEAAVRCDRLVFYVHKDLVRLVRDVVRGHTLSVEVESDDSDGTWPSQIDVIGMPAVLPKADAFCPIMSLPHALEIGDFRFHSRPYIGTEHYGLPDARKMPVRSGDKWRIGICWAGSADHDHDEHRSFHLREFMPLIDRTDTQVHSLQMGPAQRQIAELGLYGVVDDCSNRISDMADTRDLIAQLDLVCTCDTSVAHLAAAMGKPTWLFLNDRGVDWRWGVGTSDSIWYPSMTLWRRRLDEPWSAPVGKAAHTLTQCGGVE